MSVIYSWFQKINECFMACPQNVPSTMEDT